MTAFPLCSAVLLAAMMAACGATSAPTAPSPPVSPGSTPDTSPSPNAPEWVRYRLTFESTWTATTHPIDFPAAAHFSALVGGTHDATVSFWRDGGLSTEGIRAMAERGRTTPLDAEIDAAVRTGSAGRVYTGGGIGTSPGSVTLEFDVSQRHPLVTFVSMVAPSPDWFVGVSGLPLYERGQWATGVRIDLVPWDAGTDSGSTFTSGDRDTQPRAPISRIVTSPLSPNGTVRPMGTFTFARIE